MFFRFVNFHKDGAVDHRGYESIVNLGDEIPHLTKILVFYAEVASNGDHWRTVSPFSKWACTDLLKNAIRVYEVHISGETYLIPSDCPDDPFVKYINDIYVNSLKGQPDPLERFKISAAETLEVSSSVEEEAPQPPPKVVIEGNDLLKNFREQIVIFATTQLSPLTTQFSSST